ncbi:ParB N-terminal domain-containing protein [Azospirillum doebereinerae]|nr:ParB N-terminal domain-containing protein [Azospirillum doebereinerae]
MTSQVLELVTLPVADLVANPRNARVHPPEQIDRLASSLRQFGQHKPVVARRDNRMLIAGHGLWQAAQIAGLAQVRVLLWDVDQRTADAAMVADNQLGDLSADDPARLEALLDELVDFDPAVLGFDAATLDRLLHEAVETMIPVHEVATRPVGDRFWVSVKGPLHRQAAALDRLKAFMREVPEVEVELGTVSG